MSERLRYLHLSPHNNRVSNQGRWDVPDMRHVWGRRQIHAYKILVVKSERKNYLEDIRVNARMILKWILKNRMTSGFI